LSGYPFTADTNPKLLLNIQNLFFLVTRIRDTRYAVWIPAWVTDFSVVPKLQTDSGFDPASYSLQNIILSGGKTAGARGSPSPPSSADLKINKPSPAILWLLPLAYTKNHRRSSFNTSCRS